MQKQMPTALKYQEIIQMHVDMFGIEPIVTGANYWDDDPLTDRVLNAIDSGQPYIEDTVPKGTDI